MFSFTPECGADSTKSYLSPVPLPERQRNPETSEYPSDGAGHMHHRQMEQKSAQIGYIVFRRS